MRSTLCAMSCLLLIGWAGCSDDTQTAGNVADTAIAPGDIALPQLDVPELDATPDAIIPSDEGGEEDTTPDKLGVAPLRKSTFGTFLLKNGTLKIWPNVELMHLGASLKYNFMIQRF